MKPHLKYLAALLLFGSNGAVAGMIALGSGQIVLLRTLVGSLFLVVPFVLARGRLACLRSPKCLALLVASGAAMGASWMFLYEAYQQVGVGMATLAYYCGPVLVIAVSPLVFGERLSRAKVGGIAVVLAGMVLVNGGSLQRGGMSWGLAFGLAAAALFALMVVLSKKAQGADGLERSLVQLAASFVTVAAILAAQHGFDVAAVVRSALPAPGDLAPALFLGVVNTGLGCYLYFSSIPQLPAGTVAVCGYLEPLSALAFATLLLHEQMALVQLAGALLVVGGAAAAELSGKRRASAARPLRPAPATAPEPATR
ncbi:DMT family transporter [Eggerthella guodeyinii]|nr:DMT family transporter [Eggerthella guodeyinii]